MTSDLAERAYAAAGENTAFREIIDELLSRIDAADADDVEWGIWWENGDWVEPQTSEPAARRLERQYTRLNKRLRNPELMKVVSRRAAGEWSPTA